MLLRSNTTAAAAYHSYDACVWIFEIFLIQGWSVGSAVFIV